MSVPKEGNLVEQKQAKQEALDPVAFVTIGTKVQVKGEGQF